LETCREAITTNKVTIPSPLSGRTLNSNKAIHICRGTFAYRFQEDEHLFYVFASSWTTQFLCIFWPAQRTAIFSKEKHVTWLKDWLGQLSIVQAFRRHIIEFAGDLTNYLRKPTIRFALTIFETHLAHHLWQELTGIEEILSRVGQDNLPELYILNRDHSEHYGKIEEIFPEFSGRIHRELPAANQLISHMYRNGITPLRAATEYVKRKTAHRIIASSEQRVSERDKDEYDHLIKSGFRIFLLGLRVENRTLVNLTEFYKDVIAILQSEVGKLAIVLDGHSASADSSDAVVFQSHYENVVKKSPHLLEKKIANHIQREFESNPDVRILSNIGVSMAAGIFWCSRSEFFVAPWGAGLAKYRWACNRPGLILGGPKHLRMAGEPIHMYDSPKYMEAPEPVLYNDPTEAEDVPEARHVIAIPEDPFRLNYIIHAANIRHHLQALLRLSNLGS
jgi:hypothetical protein